MNTTAPHPNLHYFQSTRVPQVGDCIAAGSLGTCRIVEITPDIMLRVRNLFTGEELYAYPSDCDWLEEIGADVVPA